MANSRHVGAVLAVLLSVGVIATLLAVLMSLGGSEEVMSPPARNDDIKPTEGDFIYSEVLGQGKLMGRILPQDTALFTGIPFARPPTGDHRWRKPRQAVPFEHDGEYYDATNHRAGCPQNCSRVLPGPETSCPDERKLSEDCLYLAIYIPSRLTRKINTKNGFYYQLIDGVGNTEMPVMVFIHGGAFLLGGNGAPLFDARFIAEEGDVIVVVPNYSFVEERSYLSGTTFEERIHSVWTEAMLGPLGFLYQDTGNEEAALGNFGMWDQIEALTWIKKHIRDFGGDPYKVTMFGQSAGAQSIAVHLVNDYSAPLFHQAILQSNPMGITYKTKAEAQLLGDRLADKAGCSANDMTCLRSLSSEKVFEAFNELEISDLVNVNSFSQIFEPWAPMLDGDLLSEHPFYTFQKGTNQNKPIIHGFTTNEAMFFVNVTFPEPQTGRVYQIMMSLLFGDKSTEILSTYPRQCSGVIPPPGCDDRYPMSDVVSDYLFTCPSRYVFSQSPIATNIWAYSFNQPWSFKHAWGDYTMCFDLPCHSGDLPYIFNLETLTDKTFSPEESEFSKRIIWYWTSFAKYGNPNGDIQSQNQPISTYWPRMFEELQPGENYKTLDLSAKGETVLIDFAKSNCDMFDAVDLYLNDSIKLPIEEFNQFLSTV